MIDVGTLINPESIAEYVTALPQTNLIGESLFPRKKQMGLDITMIRGAANLPIVLKPSQFDTAVKIRSLRAQVTEETKEMPFFKEAVVIKEKDRQNLLMALSASNTTWRDLILDNIYGDTKGLIDGADMQVERMRMQLLATGAINITSGDKDIILDYGLLTASKETLVDTAKWDDLTNSNPVLDIQRWQDGVELVTGVRPTRAVCSRTTFRYIQNNVKVRMDINPLGTTIITEAVLKTYIADKLGVSIEIIVGNYIAEDDTTTVAVFPEHVFTLFPVGSLGNTYYGTTPEEADLITGNSANVSIIRSGIAVTTVKKTDPVTIVTKVSQVCLPSFEKIAEIFIATIN